MGKYAFFIIFLLTQVITGCSKIDSAIENWQEDFLLETIFINNDKRLMNYDAINENEKQIAWQEEFDNNNSKFPFDIAVAQHYVTASIQNGNLFIDYKNEQKLRYAIPFTIDESKNFELEIRCFVNDDFDFFKEKPVFVFVSTKNIEFQIYLKEYWFEERRIDLYLAKNEEIFDWNSNDYLKLNEFSAITVRKIGNKYAFFVNHKLFYILNDEEFSCNKSHIVLNRGRNIFDYVRVSYLRND